MTSTATIWIPSPLGRLRLVSNGRALTVVQFHADAIRAPMQTDPVLDQARLELEQYFQGKRTQFDVLLAPQGSEFQLKVWDALRAIPYGQTTSYGAIARSIGQPGAARAVGLANNRNPLAVIVPCHRVIGSQGALVGYGGGLAAKQWLLQHELEIQVGQTRLLI